jgi:hypothetical protein
MRKIAQLIVCWALATDVACSQDVIIQDARIKTLNPREAIEEADVILIAVPLSSKDLRGAHAYRDTGGNPIALVEVETTLRVLQVIKGPSGSHELSFRFYDSRESAQIGPPRGPSGDSNSASMFFLNQDTRGFRALVDVFRPDIPVDWLNGRAALDECGTPSQCIGRFLLTYRESDDATRFAERLADNMAIVRQVNGYVQALELLQEVIRNASPPPVRHAACVEMLRWYAMEAASACLGSESPAATPVLQRRALLLDQLKRGGVAWIRNRIDTHDDNELKRYFEILKRSDDPEVRRIALQVSSGAQ